MTVVITKEHLNNIVFLLPTGNNVTRGSGAFDQVELAYVTKVGRRYVAFDGGADYRLSNNGTKYQSKDCCNSGYVVYNTFHEAQQEKVKYKLSHKISDQYPYSSSWEKLSYEQITKIAEILGISIETSE
jgi:hypothetical protein